MQKDRWITDMAQYFAHNKSVPEIRINMLLDVYEKHEPATLERAAYLYMMDNEHFPSVAKFRPYVDTASHEATARTIRRVHRYSDDVMYNWELARGTMRPMTKIEAEIDEARIELAGLDGVPSWRQKTGGR